MITVNYFNEIYAKNRLLGFPEAVISLSQIHQSTRDSYTEANEFVSVAYAIFVFLKRILYIVYICMKGFM